MTSRKTIFITGGASGIGRAVAVKFGGQGWFVGLADRPTDFCQPLPGRLPTRITV